MIRKHVIKYVQTPWEKMHVCYHLCLDHARATTRDMHITLKPSHVRASTMEDAMAIIIDLSQMMSAKLYALKMIQILPNTWSTNVAFQLNLGLVLETLRGKTNKTKYIHYLIFLHNESLNMY